MTDKIPTSEDMARMCLNTVYGDDWHEYYSYEDMLYPLRDKLTDWRKQLEKAQRERCIANIERKCRTVWTGEWWLEGKEVVVAILNAVPPAPEEEPR